MTSHKVLIASLLLLIGCVPLAHSEKARSQSPARIVAIGDIHGDFQNFQTVLRDTGLVNKRGRWVGGDNVLVQLGDVPDRGPDTRKIIGYLEKLKRQAKKAGGEVHALIGNHESMNMQGDLRYVHPGEYKAFVDRGSEKRRKQYYKASIEHIKGHTPEANWPAFDAQYREDWNKRFPLGYVEHRIAWAPTGDLGRWVLGNSAVAKVGDTLFLHGGLSVTPPFMPISEINTRVRTELAAPDNLSANALVNSPDGPLWYRGLATLPETPENQLAVETMLDYYDAKRIVVGHTPVLRTLVPRFSGRVVLADVGLSKHYGGATAALVLENEKAWLYQNGKRIALPNDHEGVVKYLADVRPLAPNPELIDQYLEKIKANRELATEPAAQSQ
ncbi:MAG: metallophosphoesterase [Pseudomonadota bacterium]